MPYVLRGIDKKNWDKDKFYAEYPWLVNHIPAYCFRDIIDGRNLDLSLWYVEGLHDPKLYHICAAIAATRRPSHFEYGLFDISAIEQAGFEFHETPGQVPDNPEDSIIHLHRDIKELTASKLLRFLNAIWDTIQTGRVEEKEIAKLIFDKQLDKSKRYVNGKWKEYKL